MNYIHDTAVGRATLNTQSTEVGELGGKTLQLQRVALLEGINYLPHLTTQCNTEETSEWRDAICTYHVRVGGHVHMCA